MGQALSGHSQVTQDGGRASYTRRKRFSCHQQNTISFVSLTNSGANSPRYSGELCHWSDAPPMPAMIVTGKLPRGCAWWLTAKSQSRLPQNRLRYIQISTGVYAISSKGNCICASAMRRWACAKYLASNSTPIKSRPNACAATPVVPLPIKQSRTVAPGLLLTSTI